MRKLSMTILAGAVTLGAACSEDEASTPDAGAPGDSGAPDAGSDARMDATVPAPDGGGLTGAALIARGRYLVDHVGVCGDCHTPRLPSGAPDLTRYLAGSDCFADAIADDPQQGCIASRNLTDHETGLKNRSAQEIKDMFLTGVRPDGKAMLPTMPYAVLGNMRAEDADAIVAYLRTVPGVDHTVGPSQPPFTTPPAPAPRLDEALIPRPLPSYPDQEAALRGRYLAGSIGVCLECHSQRDAAEQLIPSKLFQGGNFYPAALLGLPPGYPALIYASNLTPHATGIADYTIDDIVSVIKQGIDKNQDGTPICAPMPVGPMGAFAGMVDADARDIAHYLRSLAPAENVVPSDCLPPGFGDAGVPDGGTGGDAQP